MKLDFISPRDQEPGTIASLLKRIYSELVQGDPVPWAAEEANWDQYDREVFGQPETVGACIFLTRLDGRIVGLGSWDPRQRPQLGIVGQNGILPEFRGRGFGRLQIQEILRRFQELGIETAKVSTNDHPFFAPAQHMYAACGFHEVRRMPWERDPRHNLIEYQKRLPRAP